MKKLAMCLLAILFLVPMMALAQDVDIMVCKRTNADGTASFMFPSVANYNRCLNGWEPLALQDALAGMTDSLEAEVVALKLKVADLETKTPVKYDRIFVEHTNSMPNPPDPWICTDGKFSRVILPTQLPHGWDTIWDNQHGWTAVHYYKCIPGSGPACPASP